MLSNTCHISGDIQSGHPILDSCVKKNDQHHFFYANSKKVPATRLSSHKQGSEAPEHMKMQFKIYKYIFNLK